MAEFIILGTLLLLIVLAVANIFVSKTHIMEVKHDTSLVMGTNYNHNAHGREQTQRSGGNKRRNGTATTTLTHTTEGSQKKKKSSATCNKAKSHKTEDGHVTRMAKSRSGDYESDDGWSDFEDEEDYGRTEVDKDNLSILHNVAANQEYFTFGDL